MKCYILLSSCSRKKLSFNADVIAGFKTGTKRSDLVIYEYTPLLYKRICFTTRYTKCECKVFI